MTLLAERVPAAAEPRHWLRSVRRWAAVHPVVPRAWRLSLYAIAALGLIALLAWSAELWRHDDLTQDFANRAQGAFLISHGHLNPTDSFGAIPYWQDQSSWIDWPLAFFERLGLGSYTLMVEQDIFIVATGYVALAYALTEIWSAGWLRSSTPKRLSLGILLLAALNPWWAWTTSFDIHEETVIGGFFALCTLLAVLRRNPRRALLWALLTISAANVSASYLLGIGLVALVCRKYRNVRLGLALFVGGVAWVLLAGKLGGAHGSKLAYHYGYLAGSVTGHISLGQIGVDAIRHPGPLFSKLVSQLPNTWAFSAPEGFAGLLNPVGFLSSAPIFATNELTAGTLFSSTPFQYFAAFGFLIASSAGSLIWLAHKIEGFRFPWVGLLCAALTANAVGWAAVWTPRLPSTWQATTPAAAAALEGMSKLIGPDDEVVVSQGLAGRFAERTSLEVISGAPAVLYDRPTVWFVVSAYQGLENRSVADMLALNAQLAGPMHATLVTHAADVWLWRWRPAATQNRTYDPANKPVLKLPRGASSVPAWAARSAIGVPELLGPSSTWRLASTGVAGYLLDGLVWRETPGTFRVQATLANSQDASLEVWDQNSGQLLLRQNVPADSLTHQASADFSFASSSPATDFRGHSVFRILGNPPDPGRSLEVRLHVGAGATATVSSLGLVRLP